MNARVLFLPLAFLLAAAPCPGAETNPPVDFSRAKELFAKSRSGTELTAEEQAYLDRARREFQNRTGLSGEDMEKLRAIHDKAQAGTALTPEEQQLLDNAKARLAQASGSSAAAPGTDSFDWQRARALHERAQRGETLSAEDQKFYDEARRRVQEGRGPGAAGGESDPDMRRARAIYERKQKGETLTAEEEKILEEAMKRRRGGDNPSRGRDGGASGQPVADAALLKTLVPLPELTATYKGQDGGLYGGGKNQPGPELAARAAKAVAGIQPLGADGKPAANGKIVLLSIGMSNTTMEFSRFVQKANADARKSPAVVLVDGAQGGKDATAWATADAPPWQVADERLKTAGVTPQQVQAIWIKQALIRPQADFPAEADRLHDRITEILKLAAAKYPNLRVVFLSSRTYAGFATSQLNPEPHAYESAFAVRRLIQEQPKDGPGAVLLWGPYIWAAGTRPNQADGFSYGPGDVGPDGTHPSDSGRDKVADALLGFFTADPHAKPWFVKAR